MNRKVSFIIPAFNASHILIETIPPLVSFLHTHKVNHEIIIVDDGSRDQEIVKKIATRMGWKFLAIPSNKGKGHALRKGASEASGEYLIFTDVDIPFTYDSILEMVNYLKTDIFDVVIGDRTLPKSSYYHRIPILRSIGSSFFSFVAGRFISGGFFDTQCGLKGFRKDKGKFLFSRSTIDRFGIDVELLYMALKTKMSIKRIPVQLRSNTSSSVHLIRDGIQMLIDLMSIPIKFWSGLYKLNTHKKVKNGDLIRIDGSYQYNALYSGNPIQRFWHFAKYDQAIKLMNSKENGIILDVGCGSGVLAFLFAKNHPKTTVIGIDSNLDAINFCLRTYKLPNLRFKKGFVEKIPFPNNTIDGIFFLEVVEHIYPNQADKTFTQFQSLLKKDGILIVSTPNYASFWPLIEVFLDYLKLVPHLNETQHVTQYNGTSLSELGRQNGFSLSALYSINLFAPLLNCLHISLAKRAHSIETFKQHTFGNILVASFKKKGN